MSTEPSKPTTRLPDYIASAKPNPVENRAPWYKNTAPSYAGIFLWFVFWQDAVNAPNHGGLLAHGIGWALLSLVLAAVVCHALFYLVPGMLGMKTGQPLYIVGTSLFGAQGGFLLPGFLMGLLQFGWLGVNIYFSSLALGTFFGLTAGSAAVKVIMVVWGVLAALVGLKGIQYVGKIGTYLPLVPLAVLVILLAKTAGGLGSFDPQKFVDFHKAAAPEAPAALSSFGVLAFMLTYIVGFFATAGAAGVDFGTSSRNKKDVTMGGLVGIALAIIVTGGLSILIVAGAYGLPEVSAKAVDAAGGGAVPLQSASTPFVTAIMGKHAGIILFLLALAAFPSACFSAFIAANSFKTTLSKVNPFVSVGLGAAVSILLAVTGVVSSAIIVFQIIGATFGPICGAMLVEYLLGGGKWTGPREGFNPAGWISWLAGAVVGVLPILKVYPVPAAPVAAFIVGAVVYFILAKAGMQTKAVEGCATVAGSDE